MTDIQPVYSRRSDDCMFLSQIGLWGLVAGSVKACHMRKRWV